MTWLPLAACLLSVLSPYTRGSLLSEGIEISHLHIVSAIRMRFATTQVTQEVRNAGPAPKEFFFVAYFPQDAFVSNFTMESKGVVSVGSVAERQPSANVYDMIHHTRRSIAKAPMSAQAFSATAVIGGNSSMKFVLTYEEVLERRHGAYRSGVYIAETATEMKVHVRILERGKISRRRLRVPRFDQHNALRSNAHLLSLPKEPRARLRPSISNQVSAVDLVFKPRGTGQLVLLYDLERSQSAGHMEISDGHFVHFIAPPPGRKMAFGTKNVVFVVDASASMKNKWTSVVEGMEMVLSQTGPGDIVNVLLFNGRVSAWQLESLPANEAAKADALAFLRQARLHGSSDLRTALGVATDLLRLDKSKAMVDQLFLITDTKHNGENAGRRKEKEILELLESLNPRNRLAINAVALGKDSHYGLLRRIAASNRGKARLVHLGPAAAASIHGFFTESHRPLLRDLRVKYASSAVQLPYLVSQQGIQTRDYFHGGEILLAGKINVTEDTPRSFRVSATGRNSRGRQLSFRSLAKVRPSHASSEDKFVQRIWAFLTIKGLLRVAQEGRLHHEMRAKVEADAVRLALQHNYVTELTALDLVPLEVDWGSSAPAESTTMPPANQQLILIPPDRDPLRELLLSLEKGFNPLLFTPPTPGPKILATTASAMLGGAPRASLAVPLRELVLLHSDDAPDARRLEAEESPMEQMSLGEVTDFFNPGLFTPKDPDAGNMTKMMGPVTRSLQSYHEMKVDNDPGLHHFMHTTKQWIQPCGYGHKVDLVFAIDVSDDDPEMAGPGLRFVLVNLLQRLLTTFTFTHQETRVGLIAFDGDPEKGTVLYRLSQNQNPNALLMVLSKVSASAVPGSKTQNVFRLGYRLFKEAPNRARRTMVLLSNRNDFAPYQRVVAKVRKAGLRFVAISPKQREPRILAGLRQLVGGDESLVFTEPNPTAIAAEFC